MGEWVNKMWSIHTGNVIPPPKRKEIMSHNTTQMNLRNIVLREISQLEEDECCMIPFRCGS